MELRLDMIWEVLCRVGYGAKIIIIIIINDIFFYFVWVIQIIGNIFPAFTFDGYEK